MLTVFSSCICQSTAPKHNLIKKCDFFVLIVYDYLCNTMLNEVFGFESAENESK